MAKQPTAKPDGADDLAILHPDRQATIAGRPLVMREYRFAESLQLDAPIASITAALAKVAASDAPPSVDAFRPLFAAHADVVPLLLATACDQPVEWVRELGDEDGHRLLLLWWSANSGFFGRRVVRHLVEQEIAASAGPMSMPHSPGQATAATVSSPTRVVN